MLLRKYLKGAILQGARQVDFDRILHVAFRHEETEVRLVLETMGKHSNVMLVNADGVVLDAIKRVGSRESRVRPIYPGVLYALPPTTGKADPVAATPEVVQALLADADARTLRDRLGAHFNLGPTALDTVLASAGKAERPVPSGPAQASPDGAAGEAVAAGDLTAALRAVAEPVGHQPALVCDARQVPVGVSFLPQAPVPAGGSRKPAATASEALEAYFSYRVAYEAVEARRREMLRAVSDAIRHSERRIREAEEGVDAAGHAPELEHQATLLISNVHRVRRGAASITVADFYDPEQKEVTLPLDPALTPHEQAERWFKRARKLVDAVPHLERQWGEEQERLERLLPLRARADAARTAEDLDALALALREAGGLRGGGAGGTPVAPSPRRPAGQPGVQHRDIGGFEVLMGRNATENDYLTTRLADPQDLWLHARGITSAHVVIRTGRHPERVPPEVLREAARLCALHSAAKHSRLVPVDYMLRKHVVKRRGSPPGQVHYTHEKTIDVEPGL